MSDTPKMDRELAGWIEGWQLGTLDEASQAGLAERLEFDPAARKAFMEAVRFEALLHLEFPDTVVHIPRARPAWYRKAAVPLAAAAAVALFVTIGQPWRSSQAPPVSKKTIPSGENSPLETDQPSKLIDSTPVARIDSIANLKLDPSSMPMKNGGLLPPGRIQMVSGEAELTFFSGARVSLQGPCVFVLKSDFRASLKNGRMTAEVPQEAIGFTIHTPTGQLRDLGTSFAVNVEPDGVSDVHVLEGEVEATSRDGSSVVTLGVNQASRIVGDRLMPIAFIADGWPEKPTIASQVELPESVHWTFDKFERGKTLDEKGVHPLWMRNGKGKAGKDVPAGRIQPGIRGKALAFNGQGQFAESTYRGISGDKPRSVSLWVNIPPEASYTYPNGILSWGTQAQSRKWQVCWNNGDQGTVGALRVEFGDGYLIGTTDLRDGRWHHLGVVYLGGSDSDVASHVKLYVDGRLETLSGRRSQYIRTDTESRQSVAVTLGRWLGIWPGMAPFYFRGAIDEVRIFEKALLPSQVASLAHIGQE